MAISGVSGHTPTPVVTPHRPSAPTPPPGGNIEQRQAPVRSAPPPHIQSTATGGRGGKLDVTA